MVVEATLTNTYTQTKYGSIRGGGGRGGGKRKKETIENLGYPSEYLFEQPFVYSIFNCYYFYSKVKH